MIAADPRQGGATWAMLQYVLGLRQLGHDVYFVEPLKTASLRPAGAPLPETENAAYFRKVVSGFGLEASATLLGDGSSETVGPSYDRLREIAGRAELLLNVSGMLTDEALTSPIPVRAYVDLDPAFVQLWHA